MAKQTVLLSATALVVAACPLQVVGQAQAPVTRAQVQCELRALEGAGYHPAEEDFYYPRNLQAAQARLAKQNKARGLPPGGSCDPGKGSAGATPSSEP
jgi:hypothetical protein